MTTTALMLAAAVIGGAIGASRRRPACPCADHQPTERPDVRGAVPR